MTDETELARGLAAFLTDQLGAPVTVDHLRAASAGARRRNVVFRAHAAHDDDELVATIIPSSAVQVMDIETEAACLRFAETAGVPAPRLHAVCTDSAYVGGPFFLSKFVAGDTIPRNILRKVVAQPALADRMVHDCAHALSALHAADPTDAPAGLDGSLDGDPVDRALQQLGPLFEALLQPSPAFRLAQRWLQRERPQTTRPVCVVHGDFRNGNWIVDDRGLAAALDWEIAHLGDPMEDLGWLCQRMWRFRNDELEVGGFGTRADLKAAYQNAGGTWDDHAFHWWKVEGTLRWGLGLAGQAAAHLDGSVPNIVMAASGRRVAELEYDCLMLIKREYTDKS